jgi:hypothetical protein
MIDAWAVLGIIDGGAMVDTTDDEPENWRFLIPDYADPYGPYRAIPPLGRFHWHYVLPDPKVDSARQPWTSASLRSAVLEGRAAVVTVGHILMLGGDFFPELDDMKALEPRKPVHAMSGFDRNDPLARLTLDGMLSRWAWSAKEAAKWKMLGRPGGIPQDGDEERQHLQKQKAVQKDLAAIVEFVRKARGPTRMSEVHLLSRLVGSGKRVQPQTIDDACPWIRRGAVNLLGKIATSYILECVKDGWDVDFFHTVASNGHYLALARENYPHFSENRENWNKFESYHRKALERIEAQSAYVMPLPAEALALTAFGLHFMTDAFSAGHMRVPRRALGPDGGLAAKVMHDTDNILGLLVKDGFGDTWRAFGDDFLAPDRFESGPYALLQMKIVESSTGGNAEDELPRNLEKVKAAVASAFKQLFVLSVQKARKSKSSRFAGLVVGGGIGRPGPERTDWYARSVDQHLQYMSKHRPEALPAGSVDDGKSNHPPLFNPDLSVNMKDDVYDTPGQRILRLNWYSKTKEHFQQGFAKFYYLSVATRNEKGWVEPTEKKVIDLFDKLSARFQEKLNDAARDDPYTYDPY